MQLSSSPAPASLRGRLRAAACTLLALGAPGVARAAPPIRWHADLSALYYSESGRTSVLEPQARFTRLFPGGQSLSARLGLDTMTGATPSGVMPDGRIHTTTTPSGNVVTLPPGQLPVSSFKDTRGSLDLDWVQPLGGVVKATTGVHLSRERDYSSAGANATISVDLMQKLTTVTLGGSYNRDHVDPMGGLRVGLSDGTQFQEPAAGAKRVSSGTVGVSRVLTRRWLVGINASRGRETGYLTEPYKLVSVLDGRTGLSTRTLTELRPDSRQRSDVLISSVYQPSADVLHLSYRYYRDDWGVRSSTIDLRYRHDLDTTKYLQPHVRFYTQTAADFFTFGLVEGAPLPAFATSDYRLGALRTLTLGAKYGFRVPNAPGEFSVRGEYMLQYGDGHPSSAIGDQKNWNLFPSLSIGSLSVAYSVDF